MIACIIQKKIIRLYIVAEGLFFFSLFLKESIYVKIVHSFDMSNPLFTKEDAGIMGR